MGVFAPDRKGPNTARTQEWAANFLDRKAVTLQNAAVFATAKSAGRVPKSAA